MSERMIMLDGPETSIPHFSPICTYCKHWRIREGRACAAFPERDSIPMVIWRGENDHRTPFPGDHGIQFEPIDTEYARQRFAKKTPAR